VASAVYPAGKLAARIWEQSRPPRGDSAPRRRRARRATTDPIARVSYGSAGECSRPTAGRDGGRAMLEIEAVQHLFPSGGSKLLKYVAAALENSQPLRRVRGNPLELHFSWQGPGHKRRCRNSWQVAARG